MAWNQFTNEVKMKKVFKRFEKILKKGSTALLVIDLQEKIMPVIINSDRVIDKSVRLIQGFKVLNLPIFYTEQYPKGLGSTHESVKKELEGLTPINKMSFSCFGADDLFIRLEDNNITSVVVAGVESHVCVLQTVLDLLENGFQVNVPADAISSRTELDYMVALDRMRQHGAEVTTTESILFELLEVCGTAEFKSILKIVR